MASVQTIDNASTPWPTIDRSMLINLRDAFDNPTGHTESNYPKPGQVLIHELPHAWPIENLSFLSRCICNGAARGRKHCDDGAPYLETGTTSDPPGRRSALSSRPPWSTIGFGGTRPGSRGTPKDQDDPYGYILDNIQLGQLRQP